jgi:hypothetical protein
MAQVSANAMSEIRQHARGRAGENPLMIAEAQGIRIRHRGHEPVVSVQDTSRRTEDGMGKTPDLFEDLRRVGAIKRDRLSRQPSDNGDNCRAYHTSSLTQGSTTQNSYRFGSKTPTSRPTRPRRRWRRDGRSGISAATLQSTEAYQRVPLLAIVTDCTTALPRTTILGPTMSWQERAFPQDWRPNWGARAP